MHSCTDIARIQVDAYLWEQSTATWSAGYVIEEALEQLEGGIGGGVEGHGAQ